MFKQIKTSEANREVVAQLSKKLNLGKENVIARIALTHSLSKDKRLDLKHIKDAKGKEYSKSVLLGEYEDVYVGLICTHYNLYKSDKNLAKYIKMHIDDGLELLNNELNENPKFDGFDFLTEKIDSALKEIN
ncbi:DndE family protein [uncultured Maribacter sp.]|uniref:DndE family protein n=1 Tax=uncultured Maribacter sp. TaxID=431308 RepID=UPI0026084164|nr:DndE family protein [uncultured Maribacter sp.]